MFEKFPFGSCSKAGLFCSLRAGQLQEGYRRFVKVQDVYIIAFAMPAAEAIKIGCVQSCPPVIVSTAAAAAANLCYCSAKLTPQWHMF